MTTNRHPWLVSDEEIKKIAEELGIIIKTDSENPGVFNKTTRELRSLASYFDEIITELKEGIE